MSGKGQSDGFQVGATSGQQLPVSEYAKLVFREEFGGGDLGGRCQTTWGSQRVWGLTVLEAGLDLSWETHAQICFHQFSLGVAKAFDASVF